MYFVRYFGHNHVESKSHINLVPMIQWKLKKYFLVIQFTFFFIYLFFLRQALTM